MRWKILAVAAISILAPYLAQAESLTVGFRNVVAPDAKLRSFVKKLKSLNIHPGKLDVKAIDALFSPRVKTFYRSLDPFQPWNRTDDLTSDYLSGAAAIMVEQGELEDGAPVPDYRPDALKVIIDQVSGGQPFGTLKEVPGAVCAPAEYKADRKAALAFARKFELDAYSLRFYDRKTTLLRKPRSKAVSVEVPAWTLMMFDHDPKAPEGWGRYEISDGTGGYMRDRDDTLGLAQHHVCFGKVSDEYRIVALFGYGL